MSAWIEEEGQVHSGIENKFEDNFVVNENKEFQKLDDSEKYLEILGNLTIIPSHSYQLTMYSFRIKVKENQKGFWCFNSTQREKRRSNQQSLKHFWNYYNRQRY